MRVGYLGPAGTYSHQVASVYFPPFQAGVELVAYNTIGEVIVAAEQKQVDVATVPLENSHEGPVLATLDQLSKIASNLIQNRVYQSPLQIIGEHYHLVEHCLITLSGAALASITNVYSHPQALGQCRAWISTQLPHASVNEVSSTAKAVQIASSNKEFAAVASSAAAKEYGMQVFNNNIQDSKYNQTRFVFITAVPAEECHAFSHLFSPATSTSKRSSVYMEATENNQELTSFFKNTSLLNVTSIHSRPMRGTAWKRSYFIDMDGDIGNTSGNVCVIGCYPSREDQKMKDA